jgi:hypothetical protein
VPQLIAGPGEAGAETHTAQDRDRALGIHPSWTFRQCLPATIRHISERDLAQLSVGYRYHPLNVHHDRLREGGKGPSIGSLVMRNQGLADREASVGSRPVDTSRWATSPILVWVSRAARRSLSKAVIAST